MRNFAVLEHCGWIFYTLKYWLVGIGWLSAPGPRPLQLELERLKVEVTSNTRLLHQRVGTATLCRISGMGILHPMKAVQHYEKVVVSKDDNSRNLFFFFRNKYLFIDQFFIVKRTGFNPLPTTSDAVRKKTKIFQRIFSVQYCDNTIVTI